MHRTLLLVILAAASVFPALNVPLDVSNWSDVVRTGEPVTAGVCLPSGAVYDLSLLCITDASGNTVPAQFKWLSKWWWEKKKGVAADPSVKWVLCDFQAGVPASNKSAFFLKDGNSAGTPATDLEATEDASGVTVVTGPLKFIVSKEKGDLFDGAWLDADNNGLFETAEMIIGPRTDNGGVITAGDWSAGGCVPGTVHTSTKAAPERVIIEEQGPLKIVIRVEGRHYAETGGVTRGLYGYQAFITAYAGKPYVDVQWAVTNTYMEGTEPELGANPYKAYIWPFQGYSLNLNLGLNPSGQSYALMGSAETSGSLGSGAIRLLQKKGSYTVNGTAAGALAKGGAMVTDGTLGVMVALRDFAPNSPKAVLLDQNKISLELFPDTGGFYYLDPYSRKNHRMRFEFFSGSYASGTLGDLWKRTDAPLRMMAPQAWYRDCRAWDRGFGIPASPTWNRLNSAAWTRMYKPAATDWVNYSTIEGYTGAGDHWNLTSGFWTYLLKGNPADFEYAEGKTFYFNDIVNVHTSYTRWEDLRYVVDPSSVYSSQFTAHHSPEFRYQAILNAFPGFTYHREDWPDVGHMPVLHVLEYYLLTGDPATRDAVESHGVKAVAAMYFYIARYWPYANNQGTPADTSRYISSAGRNISRPIITANHAYEITGDERYFDPMNIHAHNFCNISRRSPIGYMADPWVDGYTHNTQGAVDYWCANHPCSTGTQAQIEASIPKGFTMSDFQLGIAHTALYGFWQVTRDENVRDALIFGGRFLEWVAGKKDTVNAYGSPVQYTGFQYSNWCDFLDEGKRYSDVAAYIPAQYIWFYQSASEALGGLAFSYMVSGMDLLWPVLKDGALSYPTATYTIGGDHLEYKIINLWEAVHRHDSLDRTPPEAVTDLSAAFVPGQGVRLDWTAPQGGAVEYQVKYATAPIVDFVRRWDASSQTGWPDLRGPLPHTDSALYTIARHYTATEEISFWGAKNVNGEPAPGLPGGAESFLLTNLPADTSFYFALVSYDNLGNVSGISNVASASTGAESAPLLPGGFGIGSAYPNPFNPSVSIRFHAPAGSTDPVTLRIYDTRGQLVSTLVSGKIKGGVHTTVWNGKGTTGKAVASGMYVCKIVCGKKSAARNIILVK